MTNATPEPTNATLLSLLPAGPSALKQALSEQFEMLDFASSDGTGDALSTRAEELLSFARSKGCASFALVAHGRDAATALYTAGLAPDAVTRLVLIAPLALGVDGAPEDEALVGKLAEVSQQTLALFGTRSAMAPPAMGGHYKRALPSCHLIHVFDAADLTNERPEAVSEVVLDFLQRGDAFLVNIKDGRVHA